MQVIFDGFLFLTESIVVGISMVYFRGWDARFRAPTFGGYVKSASTRSNTMLSVNNCVVLDNLTFQMKKGMGPFSSAKFFQPPPFVVGGFVGSKSCEQNHISFNFKDLLEHLKSYSSFTPMRFKEKILLENENKEQTFTYSEIISLDPNSLDIPKSQKLKLSDIKEQFKNVIKNRIFLKILPYIEIKERFLKN